MSITDGNAPATPVIKTEPVDHQVWDEAVPGNSVDDDGDDDGDDDDDDDEDEDIDYDEDAEAEEIARRLGDQLWADISKAQQAQAAQPVAAAATTATSTPTLSAPTSSQPAAAAAPNVPASVAHEAAAILSMKMILAFSEKDFAIRSTLASTIVPDSRGSSVLDVLTAATTNGTISTTIARALGPLMNALSISETLFSGITLGAHRPAAVPYAYALPTPPPPSVLPHVHHHHHPVTSLPPPPFVNTTDLAKRKRGETELGYPSASDESLPNAKRLHHNLPTEPLQSTIIQAAEKVSQTFTLHMDKPAVDPVLVTSIQLQLRQVYVFASTSTATSSASSPPPRELQEVGGLIQVLGVVTGVQIAPIHANTSLDVVDTDTAVYPCSEQSCSKTFSKSIFLRAHQHTVHNTTTETMSNDNNNTATAASGNTPATGTTEDRPNRCTRCSASFARHHDLKRHERSHDYTGWRCAACLKTFSRRDAIKRHRDGARAKREDDPCGTADEIEIQMEPSRAAAVSAGGGATPAAAAAGGRDGDGNEADADVGVSSNDDDELMDDTDADDDGDADGDDSNRSDEDDGEAKESEKNKEGEEGEINPSVLESLRKTVCDLHGLLQTVVAKALSGGVAGAGGRPPLVTAPAGAAGARATVGVVNHGQTSALLTGVIATAQSTVQGTAAVPFVSPLGTLSSANASSAGGPASTSNNNETATAISSLSSYGLSEEQAKMLEAAISNAALAARAQAEAEQAGAHDDNDDDDLDVDVDVDVDDEGSDEPEDEDEDADMESVVPSLAFTPVASAATDTTTTATTAAVDTVQAQSASEDSDDDMEAVVIPDGP
jgi:hypothetical protein